MLSIVWRLEIRVNVKERSVGLKTCTRSEEKSDKRNGTIELYRYTKATITKVRGRPGMVVFLDYRSLFPIEIAGDAPLTFQDAQLKLLAQVRDRIRNGEFTESGFARFIGISQPHVHNVLKGVRKLSPQILDAIMSRLHISLLDFVPMDELQTYIRRHLHPPAAEVPFLDAPIGPGLPWPQRINRRKRFPLPFPSAAVPPDLVMASLAPDPRMRSTLNGFDVALLDTSQSQRFSITPEGLYVVDRGDEAVLRFIRPGARFYYYVSDETLSAPSRWERVRAPSRNQSEL